MIKKTHSAKTLSDTRGVESLTLEMNREKEKGGGHGDNTKGLEVKYL